MLEKVRDALRETGIPVAHYGWSKAPKGDYVVYAEESGEDFLADGTHAEKAVTGTVDLFTRDETGKSKEQLETALEKSGAVWYWNSTQFEQDTGYVHHEWVVSVYG